MKPRGRVLGLGVLALVAIPAVTAFLAGGFGTARGADGNEAAGSHSRPSGEQPGTTLILGAPHDVGLENCGSEGSAVINLSDTVGTYVYVACDAVNLGDHNDEVRITSADGLVTSALPAGCDAGGSLVVPGRTVFILLAGERKQLLYRIRFECHAPATPAILPVTITVGIDHIVQPGGVDDGNPANDSATFTKNMIIGAVAPPDTDGDTILDETDLDDDNDKVFDLDEGPCGGNSLNPTIRPERLDTPGDDDGDTAVNEPLPGGSGGFDCDGDGWTGNDEALVYDGAASTAADQDPCGHDGWGADLSADNTLGVADFSSFIFPLRADGSFNKFGHPVPDPEDNAISRWNLEPNATININDLNALNPAITAPTARPPMFGGQPAFYTNAGSGIGVCPWPP